MSYNELITLLNANVNPPVLDSQKIADNDRAVLDYLLSQNSDDFPDWSAGLTFQTDGSDDGKYCKHPDSNGKKRIFETKTDNNTGNTPPSDPLVNENTHWLEISQSAGSAIREYTPGIYGSGLVIVFFDNDLYKLEEPVRPFASSNITTEILAGKWRNLTGTDNQTVDVSGATPVLNCIGSRKVKFLSSANIGGNKTFILSNDSKVQEFSFIFTLSDVYYLQWPSNFKMSDVLWDSGTKRWTPEQAGNYLARAEHDGSNYLLTISNPYT
jgi:hypothetical protein